MKAVAACALVMLMITMPALAQNGNPPTGCARDWPGHGLIKAPAMSAFGQTSPRIEAVRRSESDPKRTVRCCKTRFDPRQCANSTVVQYWDSQ